MSFLGTGVSIGTPIGHEAGDQGIIPGPGLSSIVWGKGSACLNSCPGKVTITPVGV